MVSQSHHKLGEFGQGHEYVFFTLPSRHLDPKDVVEACKELLTRAGLPDIRFHDLR